ncbi:hypothetical protein GCM10010106_49590 [Thermopolyspora flexuosa]|uniref:Uncharacterized protein with HXXEE motif n=1 Tax=Thermopolyspora flexuosa TaxID=103836 RepID=A0A543IQG8_9ACTN|nr:HXXEE domain-containing protein [Thermopolyspora flexuosa]TQM72814.1 uncharacterized protein with HXXEE motif [Thermopolyspora flexuosa]GGM94942.1 hypothetical protein GCM10010106_49590 [Thermopolyspora flexuosa]
MRPTTRIAAGLLAAWAVHDLEEVLTMRRSAAGILPNLPAWVPIPEELRREGLSQRQINLAVTLMGVAIATASAAGVRSGCRSPLFRGALLGFGVHGFTHIAMALAARRYVTGVATAPTVVIPFWLWARRELAKAGIRDDDRAAVLAALAFLPVVPGVHAAAHRLLRRRRA